MIVKKAKEIITSRFGMRKGRFHKGVDLRVVTDRTGYTQLPIQAPEDLKIIRKKFQKKWGWTIVAKGIESGYILKFTHIKPTGEIKKGAFILVGSLLGVAMITDHMKQYHLHFETWRLKIPRNPIKYMRKMAIDFGYKEGV